MTLPSENILCIIIVAKETAVDFDREVNNDPEYMVVWLKGSREEVTAEDLVNGLELVMYNSDTDVTKELSDKDQYDMLRKISRAALALLLALCMVSSFGFTFGEGNVYAAAKTKKVKVTSITLNHKVYTVKRGKSLKLKTTIKPTKAKKSAKIVWKSSSKKYATVSSKGLGSRQI